MSHLRRRLSGTLSARVVAMALAASLMLAGCSDDAKGDGPSASPSSSSASASPTTEPSPTAEPSVTPASGPRLALEDVEIRLPEGWSVDNDDASFLVVGTADDRSGIINLSSFPALNPDVSIARLGQITADKGGFPRDSVQPETTMAGLPAYHVAGPVAGDDSEQFGVLHDGDIVTVEFVFRRGPKDGRQELIDSVLATVQFR